MSGVRVTGDWGKLQGSLARLGRLDPADAHRIMTGIVLSTTLIRFRQGVDPEGNRWKPSSRVKESDRKNAERRYKASLRGKTARSRSAKTLVDQGILKSSIQAKHNRRMGAVGTNVLYAAVHQFGKTIHAKGGYLHYLIPGEGYRKTKSVEIPKRAFLGITDKDKDLMRSAFARFMRRAIR